MSYRVIQWSTGNVGVFALRAILQNPELELVGVWAHSEDKEGVDAGELCGLDPVGITATTDAEALLALGADCVCYTATGDRRTIEAMEDMARILASGANLVSCSVAALVHPKSMPQPMVEPLAEACRKGNSSLFASGIEPGFASDTLPLVLSGLCERWESIRIQEIINYATYDQPELLFEAFGFGQPLDHTPPLLQPGVLSFSWGGSLHLMAEGLGLELDEVREVHDRIATEKAIAIGEHTIEAGTCGALRFEVQGIIDGKIVLVVEHVTRMDDAVAPEWPSGAGGYRVSIEGVPRMQLEWEFEDEQGDHTVGGVLITATRLVNAIPAVCEADSGLLSVLDLPLITGRGLHGT
ncbi:MAG: diacylglycerol kinase [Deltaproteobacteria bacterium]|nr:diacylglycerol kinase [Deltaproteobacteria bacterium]MBW2418873.1 diacylglycerol kinase [Deltaproteobacteria bacterium]